MRIFEYVNLKNKILKHKYVKYNLAFCHKLYKPIKANLSFCWLHWVLR